MNEKEQIALLVETSTEYGHTHTAITIMTGRHEWITDRIAGTVDNKAGYGNLDACERVAARMEKLKAEGFAELFDPTLFDLYLKVTYQHYGADAFCRPQIKLGSNVRAIDAAISVYKRLRRTKGGFPRSPDALIARFKGAFRVIRREYDFVIDVPEALKDARKVNAQYELSMKTGS